MKPSSNKAGHKNMSLLKVTAIAAFVIAVNANTTYNYDTKFIKAINNVVLVKKSNTCVILVIDAEIQFVSTEGEAPMKLAKWHNIAKNKHLDIIKSSFKPLSTTDVVEKLSKIGKNHTNFLAYFTAVNDTSVKGTIIAQTTKPVGLVGHLLDSLGLQVEEEGLLPTILAIIGVDTNEKDIEVIEFKY